MLSHDWQHPLFVLSTQGIGEMIDFVAQLVDCNVTLDPEDRRFELCFAELGEISQLTVSPPFRQFKVADKLIDVTEQIAEENGVKTLQIEFPKSENAIIAAYKGWGFAERPVVTLQKAVKSPEPESTTEEASEPEESPETSDDKEGQQELL